MPLHPLDNRIISRIRRDLGPHETLIAWLLCMFMSSVLLYAAVTHDWSQWGTPRPLEVIQP